MLRNFLLITLRHFTRNLNYTLINVLGLSVGIAACILIFLIIRFENKFDKFHSKYESIYRVGHSNENASGIEYSGVTPYPFMKAFRNDFPDVPLATQIHHHSEVQLTYGTEKLREEHVLFADSLFFDVFDYAVLEGNPHVDLGQPGKVFLTKSLYDKLIKPGAGKTIRLNNILDLEVVGIVADPPATSHIRFTMIASMPSLKNEFIGLSLDEWGMNMAGYSYVVLPEGMSTSNITERFPAFVKKYYEPDDAKRQKYDLQPLSEIHFDSKYDDNRDNETGMTRSNLIILALLGGFILLVACINFINLSTALAARKSREIGVRKTLGASRPQLSRQFMLEALLITSISLVIAVMEVELVLPFLRVFLSKPLTISGDLWLVSFLAILTLLTALLAGAYPAWVLSRFNPVAVLKNKLVQTGSSGSNARRYLVTFQFLIAQILIIGTLVVSSQMDFFASKPLGFVHEGILNVSLPVNTAEKISSFKTRLSDMSALRHISFSLGAPTAENNFGTGYFLTERGEAERYDTDLKPVDAHYLETYGLELAAGRWFTEDDEKASAGTLPAEQRVYHYVVNEALVKQLGFASADEMIGKKITTGLNNINADVIGVVKNFHTKSLRQQVAPAVLIPFPYFYYDAGLRFEGGNLGAIVKEVEKAYNEVFPEYIFKFSFLDEALQKLYVEEHKALTLIRVFSGLSIFISCLGLLGLVSFMTQQKVKEVGVRKAFGASIENIVYLFSKEFIRLVLVSFVIAAPVGWYLMNQWLNGFAFRTDISWQVFAIAMVSTMVVALATVSYQSIRAAMANPVNSLRNE